jgi:acyl dehydratase
MSPAVVGPEELEARVGSHLGYSGWHTVSQEQVHLFAEATADQQWIHVDAERAKSGPFGSTVAHGYLTLSLLPGLLSEILEVKGPRFFVNYGLNRLRFPSPVPVGSRLRLGTTLTSLEAFDGGIQATLNCVFEVEGSSKPSCVADVIFRYYD